ncbi:hypothetical protein P4T48_18095 [Bacillus paramycoides]|uniref:hypothetical protein n=1 Tax=Bacillus paramycoides TaxID=2026194 RepID=UPI002E1E2F12|nr:hypothetical protein [Bacillus paramycoides]
MSCENDPLKITIENSEWAKEEENKLDLEWLRKNYKRIWIDNDNKEHPRYKYEHINRSSSTITVDKDGNITDGHLDTTDYIIEAELVEKYMETNGESSFELLDESDEIWKNDCISEFNNEEYIITYKPENGKDFTVTPEEFNTDTLSRALWVINKQAKAYRDILRFESSKLTKDAKKYYTVMKNNYYILKALTFKKLHKQNKLTYKGIHIGQDKKKYPYVEFGKRGFHLVATGKYLEALMEKNRETFKKTLPKIESIDFSRNHRQIDLSIAEETVCEFLQPGFHGELWTKMEREKKQIDRDNRTGKIILVDKPDK